MAKKEEINNENWINGIDDYLYQIESQRALLSDPSKKKAAVIKIQDLQDKITKIRNSVTQSEQIIPKPNYSTNSNAFNPKKAEQNEPQDITEAQGLKIQLATKIFAGAFNLINSYHYGVNRLTHASLKGQNRNGEAFVSVPTSKPVELKSSYRQGGMLVIGGAGVLLASVVGLAVGSSLIDEHTLHAFETGDFSSNEEEEKNFANMNLGELKVELTKLEEKLKLPHEEKEKEKLEKGIKEVKHLISEKSPDPKTPNSRETIPTGDSQPTITKAN